MGNREKQGGRQEFIHSNLSPLYVPYYEDGQLQLRVFLWGQIGLALFEGK